MLGPKKISSPILQKLELTKNSIETNRTNTSMRLSAIINKGIRAKGWTNSVFAQKIGKKPSVITKWLSGTHNFTSDTLTDIQDILGIKLLAFEVNSKNNSSNTSATITGNVTVNIFKKCEPIAFISQEIVLESLIGVQVIESVTESSN